MIGMTSCWLSATSALPAGTCAPGAWGKRTLPVYRRERRGVSPPVVLIKNHRRAYAAPLAQPAGSLHQLGDVVLDRVGPNLVTLLAQVQQVGHDLLLQPALAVE